jgi:hypothetical protein
MNRSRLTRGLAVLALLIAGLTAPARPAVAAVCDIACQLFTDTAAITQQRPKPFASGIGGHAETSTIVWNNQYFLYYRTFISPTGQECPIPQGIAYATSGDSGNTWTPANGGRPIAALQTVQEGQSCNQNDGVPSTWIYSPDVITDGTRLVMVFEQRDHDPNGNGPGRPRSFHSVRWVTSTDGRIWSNSTRLLAPGGSAPGTTRSARRTSRRTAPRTWSRSTATTRRTRSNSAGRRSG